jgi:PAS domain S-box-containing protein
VSKPTYEQLLERIHVLESEVASRRAVGASFNGVQNGFEGVPDDAPDLEARCERLFQNRAVGILLVDKALRILRANDQALRILGYSHDELMRMHIPDMLHPEDINAQPIITIDDIRVLPRGMTLERHYRRKDGQYVPAEVHLSVFAPHIMMILFQEVSLRLSTEEALRKANEALEMVYYSGQAAIVGMDRQQRVAFWNPAAEKLFGWRREEVMGKPYPAVPEEDRQAFEAFFNEVMKGRSYNYLEIKRRRKDGAFFNAVSSAGPLRNEFKEVNGLIAILFDITSRKQAEEALKQSEQLYRSLVENTQDGYFISELPSGRFGFLNNRICQLLGYTPREALALTLWDVIEASDHRSLEDALAHWQKVPKIFAAMVFKAKRKNGTSFRAELSGAPVTFGDQPAIQGLLRDITENERLQVQLQQAQRMESIGTLAGGVAHDFNNLLMAILGNTTLAKLGVPPKHPISERLENIITYVQDASSLTKQLLEFARGGKYEVRTTELNVLVDKTVQMFARTKKEISVHTTLSPDLWAVEVDRGQIEQVLLNLLVNAWQAMPKGGQISVETANTVLDISYTGAYGVPQGNYVRLNVADNGVGMNKAIQAKIFEPFFTTKDRGRGTGLGLASAYGIIKNHEGIINVYSEEGKGSTFTLYLPAVEKPAVQIKPPMKTKTLTGTENILLVDDEAMILQVGKAMLTHLGYQIRAACSGQEALDVLSAEKGNIDLIILDMIMPGMSGGETYDRLKSIRSDIKVLLSSGYSLSGEASRILKRGCNGFIQKPFNMEELSRKVREVLDAGACLA